MKKIIALLLVAVLALGMVACGEKAPETTAAPETNTTTTPATDPETPEEPIDPEVIPSETQGEENITTEAPVAAAENEASKALSAIWNAYTAEKFFAMGGDFNNMVNEAPGVAEDADFIQMSLVVPAEQLENIAEAASLMHAMNANTFTAGAYKLAEGADAAAFAEAVKTAIQGNQWMCGFPELLLIADVNGIIVVAFGHTDCITPFQAAVTAAYADAQILVNEAVAQ